MMYLLDYENSKELHKQLLCYLNLLLFLNSFTRIYLCRSRTYKTGISTQLESGFENRSEYAIILKLI